MTNEERAYIETDYSCAYCGIKGFENLSIDHIDGRQGPDWKKYDNLIVLCHNCHHRKTNAKGITLDEIKKLKKNLLIKTLTQYGVNAMKVSYRNDFGVASNPFFISHLLELGLFEQKGDEMWSYSEEGKTVITEALYTITDEGKRIYDKWLK